MNKDREMPRLLNRTLKPKGYDIVIVVDYDEALNKLETVHPDMVIMDTYSTDADSLRILDTIRKRSDVPIIVITSDNEPDTLKTVFAHGADDFIRKPFDIRIFIARIKAKLRRYHGEVISPPE